MAAAGSGVVSRVVSSCLSTKQSEFKAVAQMNHDYPLRSGDFSHFSSA